MDTAHRPRPRPARRLDRTPASGRTLHLLDPENLLGGRVWEDRIRALWAAYPLPVLDGDLVIAGFGMEHARGGMFALPSRVRSIVGGRGKDAAEIALLAEIDPRWVQRRFDRVVIASGDHAFAPLARALRDAGIAVTLVAGSGRISAELYIACTDDRRLHLPAA